MTAAVVAILPNAGLANKLFVWARAEVFASLNGLSAHTIGWTYPKMGPLLRREYDLRMYGRYFRSTSVGALSTLGVGFIGGFPQQEPPCRKVVDLKPNGVYIFRRIPHWRDMFQEIRDHRDLVKERLVSILRRQPLERVHSFTPPVISLHIRRGDFRTLRSGEDFAKVGGVRTPDSYFISIVAGIRSVAGANIPVTVFSDGTDAELRYILDMPNVTRSPAPNVLLDLLLMAKSRVIVPSAGSTFGEWAGYLSEAIVLRHPDHIHAPIRAKSVRERHYEGPAPRSDSEWREVWAGAIAPALDRAVST